MSGIKPDRDPVAELEALAGSAGPEGDAAGELEAMAAGTSHPSPSQTQPQRERRLLGPMAASLPGRDVTALEEPELDFDTGPVRPFARVAGDQPGGRLSDLAGEIASVAGAERVLAPLPEDHPDIATVRSRQQESDLLAGLRGGVMGIAEITGAAEKALGLTRAGSSIQRAARMGQVGVEPYRDVGPDAPAQERGLAFPLGQGLGSTVPLLVTGYVGGLPAVVAGSYLTGIGDIKNEVDKLGDHADDVIAFTLGIPYAALETVFPEHVLARLGGRRIVGLALSKGLSGQLGRVGIELAQGALEEGTTEGLQSFLTYYGSHIAEGQAPDHLAALQQAGQEALAGALTGGIIAGGVQTVNEALTERPALQQPPDVAQGAQAQLQVFMMTGQAIDPVHQPPPPPPPGDTGEVPLEGVVMTPDEQAKMRRAQELGAEFERTSPAAGPPAPPVDVSRYAETEQAALAALGDKTPDQLTATERQLDEALQGFRQAQRAVPEQYLDQAELDARAEGIAQLTADASAERIEVPDDLPDINPQSPRADHDPVKLYRGTINVATAYLQGALARKELVEASLTGERPRLSPTELASERRWFKREMDKYHATLDGLEADFDELTADKANEQILKSLGLSLDFPDYVLPTASEYKASAEQEQAPAVDQLEDMAGEQAQETRETEAVNPQAAIAKLQREWPEGATVAHTKHGKGTVIEVMDGGGVRVRFGKRRLVVYPDEMTLKEKAKKKTAKQQKDDEYQAKYQANAAKVEQARAAEHQAMLGFLTPEEREEYEASEQEGIRRHKEGPFDAEASRARMLRQDELEELSATRRVQKAFEGASDKEFFDELAASHYDKPTGRNAEGVYTGELRGVPQEAVDKYAHVREEQLVEEAGIGDILDEAREAAYQGPGATEQKETADVAPSHAQDLLVLHSIVGQGNRFERTEAKLAMMKQAGASDAELGALVDARLAEPGQVGGLTAGTREGQITVAKRKDVPFARRLRVPQEARDDEPWGGFHEQEKEEVKKLPKAALFVIKGLNKGTATPISRDAIVAKVRSMLGIPYPEGEGGAPAEREQAPVAPHEPGKKKGKKGDIETQSDDQLFEYLDQKYEMIQNERFSETSAQKMTARKVADRIETELKQRGFTADQISDRVTKLADDREERRGISEEANIETANQAAKRRAREGMLFDEGDILGPIDAYVHQGAGEGIYERGAARLAKYIAEQEREIESAPAWKKEGLRLHLRQMKAEAVLWGDPKKREQFFRLQEALHELTVLGDQESVEYREVRNQISEMLGRDPRNLRQLFARVEAIGRAVDKATVARQAQGYVEDASTPPDRGAGDAAERGGGLSPRGVQRLANDLARRHGLSPDEAAQAAKALTDSENILAGQHETRSAKHWLQRAGFQALAFSRKMIADLKRKGRSVGIQGQRVRSAADLAVAVQMFRDPHYETLRYVFVKDGEAMMALGVSVRLPGITAAFPMNLSPEQSAKILAGMADDFGADAIYMQHNHPSGEPKPSDADIKATRDVAAAFAAQGKADLFKGHVIINHGFYGHITTSGSPSVQRLPYGRGPKAGEPDPFRAQAEIPHPALGQRPRGVVALAQVVKGMELDPAHPTYAYLDTHATVVAIQTPTTDPTKDDMLRWSKRIGANQIVAYTNDLPRFKQLVDLVNRGELELVDVIYLEPTDGQTLRGATAVGMKVMKQTLVEPRIRGSDLKPFFVKDQGNLFGDDEPGIGGPVNLFGDENVGKRQESRAQQGMTEAVAKAQQVVSDPKELANAKAGNPSTAYTEATALLARNEKIGERELTDRRTDLGGTFLRDQTSSPYGEQRTTPLLGALGGPGFYSRLEVSIANSKIEKAPAQTWISKLRGQGHSADEFDWALGEALRADPKKSWTRDELYQLARQRGYGNLSETVRGYGALTAIGAGPTTWGRSEHEANETWLARRGGNVVGTIRHVPVQDTWVATNLFSGERVIFEDGLEARRWVERETGLARARYSSYVQPGGQNYRELLVQVPHGMLPGDAKDILGFESSHWEEPNVLFHIRLNDRTGPQGEKLLHIEELQSDWHQKGRREGYDSPERRAKLSELNKQLRRARTKMDAERGRLSTMEPAPEVELPDLVTPEYRDSADFEYAGEPWTLSRLGEHARPDRFMIARAEGGTSARFRYPESAATWLKDLWRTRQRANDTALQKAIDAVHHWEVEIRNVAGQGDIVGDAPLKETPEWVGLAVRRILDEAMAGGYAAITWTTGEQHADRYSLRQVVDRIEYNPDTEELMALKGMTVRHHGHYDQRAIADVIGKEAAERLLASPRADSRRMRLAYGNDPEPGFGDVLQSDPDDRAINEWFEPLYEGQTLETHWGPVTVEKIEAEDGHAYVLVVLQTAEGDGPQIGGSPAGVFKRLYAPPAYKGPTGHQVHALEGEGLEVGGTGMKAFYGQIWPSVLTSYTKKIGAKAEPETIQTGSKQSRLDPREVTRELTGLEAENGVAAELVRAVIADFRVQEANGTVGNFSSSTWGVLLGNATNEWEQTNPEVTAQERTVAARALRRLFSDTEPAKVATDPFPGIWLKEPLKEKLSKGQFLADEIRQPYGDTANPASAGASMNPVRPASRPDSFGDKVRKLMGIKPRIAQDEVKALIRISRTLAQAVKVPLRQGRFRQRALGIFKPFAHVTRVRRFDALDTVAHEIGHFISEKYLGTPTRRTKKPGALSLPVAAMKELGKMGKDLYGSRKPVAGYREEGIAQWFRFYVTEPGREASEAPTFTAIMLPILARETVIQRGLDAARADYAVYKAAGPQARVRAQISVNEHAKRPLNARDMVHAWLDDLNEFKVAVKELGQDIESGNDAYTLSRLTRGAAGAAEAMIEARVVPTLRKLAMSELDDFRDYLSSSSAVERWSHGIDPGIALADAKAVVALYDAKFKPIAEELWQLSLDLLQLRVQAGMLSPGMAKVIGANNQQRVGFYRLFDEEEETGTPGYGSTWGRLTSGLPAQHGSARIILDPLESIIRDVYNTLVVTRRHEAVLNLVKGGLRTEGGGAIVEEVPTRLRKIRVPLSQIREQIERLGFSLPDDVDEEELQDVILSAYEKVDFPGQAERKDLVVGLYIGEHRRWFALKDAKLYDAVEGLDATYANLFNRWLNQLQDAPAWVRWLRHPLGVIPRIGRSLRAGATLALEFGARNPYRDAWTGAIYTQTGAVIPGQLFLEGVVASLFNKAAVAEWKDAGGMNADFLGLDRQRTQKQIDEWLAGPTAKTVGIVKHPIEALRLLSGFMENQTRIGEDVRARRQGKSARRAAFLSREVTQDFAKQGAQSRAINQLVAFFSANIGGLDKLARELKARPHVVLPRLFLLVTLPSLALAYLHRDDDEYQKIPRWVRDLFWVLWIQRDEKGNVIRKWMLPKPPGLGQLFGSVPERILEWGMDHDPEKLKRAQESFLKGVLPPVLPTFAVPLIENAQNRSFFRGSPIVPQRAVGLAPEEQFGPYTGESFRALGGVIHQSPAKIENIWRGYTAGLGAYASALSDEGVRRAREAQGLPPYREKREQGDIVSRIPGLKAFSRRPEGLGSETIAQFYEAWERGEEARLTWKTKQKRGDKDAREYFEDHKDDIRPVLAETDGPPGTKLPRGVLRQLKAQMDELNTVYRSAKTAVQRELLTKRMQNVADRWETMRRKELAK